MRFALRILGVTSALAIASGCGGSPRGAEHGAGAADEVPQGGRSLEPGPQPVALSADGIVFVRGSQDLAGSSAAALDDLADAIARSEDAVAWVRVTLEPDPDACSGEPLASRRAEAIHEALLARGVPAARVRSEGVGDPPPGCAPVLASRSTVTVELIQR